MLNSLDHLVMTVRDMDATLRFYRDALQVPVVRFGDPASLRVALQVGRQKINLHQKGAEIDPHADLPTPGALDLCFLIDMSTPDLLAHLDTHQIEIELGPVQRDGTTGPLLSVYIRDPDKNLIELAQQL